MNAIPETSSHSSTGSPQFLIGIMAGLASTLIVLALLIVVLIRLHTRRPPFFQTTSNNPSASEAAAASGPPRLNNAAAAVKGRKGLFHTSSSSQATSADPDDPDLIPLQKTGSAPRLGKYYKNCRNFTMHWPYQQKKKT